MVRLGRSLLDLLYTVIVVCFWGGSFARIPFIAGCRAVIAEELIEWPRRLHLILCFGHGWPWLHFHRPNFASLSHT